MAKKRANGEGSIRKKPSGRWEGRYTQGIDPVSGRAIQKSVSAKTQAECKEKLAKAIRENRGVPLNHTGDYTAAEWCRLWFETYSKPNIRYNTAKGYEGIIEHHIIPAIGAIKLRQLSSMDVQRDQGKRQDAARVEAERQSAVQHLRAACPRGAAGGAEAGGERAAHPVQPLRELPHPAQGQERDDHSPTGEDRQIPSGSGEVRRPAHVLSGAVQRPAPGRTAGATVGGLECKRAHPDGE